MLEQIEAKPGKTAARAPPHHQAIESQQTSHTHQPAARRLCPAIFTPPRQKVPFVGDSKIALVISSCDPRRLLAQTRESEHGAIQSHE